MYDIEKYIIHTCMTFGDLIGYLTSADSKNFFGGRAFVVATTANATQTL